MASRVSLLLELRSPRDGAAPHAAPLPASPLWFGGRGARSSHLTAPLWKPPPARPAPQTHQPRALPRQRREGLPPPRQAPPSSASSPSQAAPGGGPRSGDGPRAGGGARRGKAGPSGLPGSHLYAFSPVPPRGPVRHPLLRPKAPSSRPQDIPKACYESAASPFGAAITTLRPHLHWPFNPRKGRGSGVQLTLTFTANRSLDR